MHLKTFLSNTPNTVDQIQIQIHGLKFDQIQIRRICICVVMGFPPLGDSKTMMMMVMMMMKTDTNRFELRLGFIPEYPFDQYTGLPYV